MNCSRHCIAPYMPCTNPDLELMRSLSDLELNVFTKQPLHTLFTLFISLTRNAVRSVFAAWPWRVFTACLWEVFFQFFFLEWELFLSFAHFKKIYDQPKLVNGSGRTLGGAVPLLSSLRNDACKCPNYIEAAELMIFFLDCRKGRVFARK